MATNIEAGKAYVRAYVDLSAIDRGLKQIQAKFEGFGSRLGGIGKGLSVVGAGFAGVGASVLAPLAAATSAFADFGSLLDDTSQRTGMSASSLSELGYAAQMSGTDLGTVEKAVSKMQKGITGAAGGSKSLNASFNSIGVSAKQLAKLAPEEQFTAVASAIGKIKDQTQRAAKAMEVFGKSGTQLLPLLTSDIAALRQEARDLGLTMSDVDAGNAAELGDSFDRIKRTIGGIGMQIGAALAEPLTKIVNITATIVSSVTKWIAVNRPLIQTIAAIAAGLVVVGGVVFTVGAALVGVGAAISAVGTIIGSIVGIATAAFGAVATAVGFILSPVGLVIAAIVGLGVYIAYSAVTATGSLSQLGEMFGSLGSTAVEAWGGIVAALSTGDLETAGQIAFTALEVGWLTVTTTIKQVWANVSAFFVNTWLSAVETIVQIGANIYFGVARYFDLLSTALIVGFDTAFVYITGAIDNIQTAIAKAIIKAGEFFGMFSKQQSMEIQSTLDSDLQRRANNRQSGLDGRTADRAAGLAQRDGERQSTAKQFSQTVSEDFKRREAKVDNSGLTAAQRRLEELRLQLSEKSAAAIEKASKGESASKVSQGEQAAAAFEQSSGGSTGTFVSGIASSIAGGGVSPLEDLGKQQLEMLSSIDGRLREATVGDDD